LCHKSFNMPIRYTREHVSNVHGALVYEMYCTNIISYSGDIQSLRNSYILINRHIYLYYLRFLCFYPLRRRVHRNVALDNTVWALGHNKLFLGSDYNLLGYCYRMLGKKQNAYRARRKSLKKKKYHNAAI